MEKPWTMPDWMKPYSHLFKFPNQIEELYCYSGKDEEMLVKALMITSQVLLLSRLNSEGLLAI